MRETSGTASKAVKRMWQFYLESCELRELAGACRLEGSGAQEGIMYSGSRIILTQGVTYLSED